MTTTEKNAAIQELRDIQHSIESCEDLWAKVHNAGGNTEKIDREIDMLLYRRSGMETIMRRLDIRFDRKEYRETSLTGETKFRTMWYLI